MTDTQLIRNAYNDLYQHIMDYMWNFDILSELADLEIECYKSFPNIDRLKKIFYSLKKDITAYVKDDEDLNNCFEEFQTTIEDISDMYVKLV